MAEDSCTAGKDRRAKTVSFHNVIGIGEWGKLEAKNVDAEACTVGNSQVLLGTVHRGKMENALS